MPSSSAALASIAARNAAWFSAGVGTVPATWGSTKITDSWRASGEVPSSMIAWSTSASVTERPASVASLPLKARSMRLSMDAEATLVLAVAMLWSRVFPSSTEIVPAEICLRVVCSSLTSRAYSSLARSDHWSRVMVVPPTVATGLRWPT